MKEKETVLLIHGFNKDGSDMLALDSNLRKLGYNPLVLELPTRFRSLEECTNRLECAFQSLLKDRGALGKIHFIGHSMGGLIIRQFLANNQIENLGRCVFIATPNKGTKLADLAEQWCRPLPKILKPLKDLTSQETKKLPSLESIPTEIGIVAGNKSNLLLGAFLAKENDGRVEVESVKQEGMKDFHVLNYGHKEIHYKLEVAKLIDNFLQKGSFTEN